MDFSFGAIMIGFCIDIQIIVTDQVKTSQVQTFSFVGFVISVAYNFSKVRYDHFLSYYSYS